MEQPEGPPAWLGWDHGLPQPIELVTQSSEAHEWSVLMAQSAGMIEAEKA